MWRLVGRCYTVVLGACALFLFGQSVAYSVCNCSDNLCKEHYCHGTGGQQSCGCTYYVVPVGSMGLNFTGSWDGDNVVAGNANVDWYSTSWCSCYCWDFYGPDCLFAQEAECDPDVRQGQVNDTWCDWTGT